MATHNPKTLGVASKPTVMKSMVDTTTTGEALVTSVTVDPGSLQSTYSGVDEGTGHVHISLPRIPESAGRTFNTVVVDDYGRVVGGAEGSLDGEYVLNSPGTRQSGGFYLDTGDVTSLQAMNINATSIASVSLSLSTPLTPANGGTGVSSVLARLAFLGPVSGAGAPSFRSITTNDLPDYPFLRLTDTPTTLAGYGIADAYDKTTSDTRYSLSGHDHSGVYEPAFATGTTAQYMRGDKSWQNLTTDVVQETATRKFYTDAYARAALSVSGTNLTYDNLGGIIGFVASPSFTSVSVTTATLPQHAAPVSLVDTKLKYRTPGVADTVPPALVDNGNGTVTIASANVTVNSAPDFSGSTSTYSISGTTLALTAGLEQYICVRYNSGAPNYYVENNRLNITASDVVGIYVVWLVGTEVHSISLDSRGLGLSSKTASMLTMTMPYKCAVGYNFVLGETTTPNPRTVTISSSLVFAGTDALNIAAFNSSNPTHRLTLVYPVAGTWTYRNDLVYDNTNYSNGTNLVAASSNKYMVRWVYRTIGDDVQAFYVIGSDQHNSVDAARLESQPSNLPIVVRNHAMLVGRIIVQYGASSGVVDQISTTSFNVGSITQHNSLDALQGGTATERYHLSEEEYLRVQEGPHLRLDGVSPMTGTLTSQAILPEINTTYNIGSSTRRYATIYSSTLNTTGLVSGTSYIGSIIPYNNESFYYDIGTNLYRYNRIYAKDITINGFSTTASSIDIGAGYRINLSGYLSSQPQMNWPTNYSSSVVAGDMSWDGTKLKVGDGTVQRVFAYTSDITSQSLSGFATGSNTAIVQSDSILQAFQKTQGQINARALTSDLGNYLPKVNPPYTGRLTGPTQYLEADEQIHLAIRRPGGQSGRIHGIAFQAQTLDSTWVEFGRVVTYISSVANGAHTGGMRLMAYKDGAIVQALDAGPDVVTFGGTISGPRAMLTEFGTLAAMPSNSNYATIHATGVTRTDTNYALRIADSGADTLVNAATTVALAVAGTAKLGVTASEMNLASGVALKMASTTVIDSGRNATFASVTTGTLTLSDFGKLTALVGDSNYAAIYGTGVTPSGSNYSLRFADDNGSAVLNASVFLDLAIGGAFKVKIDGDEVNLASGVALKLNSVTTIDSSRNAYFVGLTATGNPVFGSTSAGSSVTINSAAGTVAGINFQDAGIVRSTLQLYTGGVFRIMARNTSGVEIDSLFYADLAANGLITIGGTARTTNFKGAIQVGGTTVVDINRNGSFQIITGTQGVLGTTAQESLMLRRPGATINLLWGLDFQGQQDDLTWVNYNRLQSRIIASANGAWSGALRVINYSAGVLQVTAEFAPTYMNLATGVGIQMNNTTIVDSNRNGFLRSLTVDENVFLPFSVIWKSGTTNYFSIYATSIEFGLRDLNDAGSAIAYPLIVKRGVGGEVQIGYSGGLRPVRIGGAIKNDNLAGTGTRPVVTLADGTLDDQNAATFRGTIAALASADPNFTGILYQDGFQRIASDGTGWFQYLNSSALVGSTIRPLVVRADGLFIDQDAATFRTTIGVLPYATITGTVDFNSLNSGTVGNYRVQGSSYTNAPPGASSSVTYDLWQGNAGGRLVQRVTDTWWGGSYHRFQIGANSNAWSPWMDILDSGLLPTTTLTKSFLATSTTSAARAVINAAGNPEKTTKNGSWNLDANTPLCVLQTASGTLTLPTASSTYQCKSYIITASTTVTLTISGSYCYLDTNNSASYWYDTTSSVAFNMNGGHVSGNRKMIEIWCDGVEWYVRC